jgi:hypothetical protein
VPDSSSRHVISKSTRCNTAVPYGNLEYLQTIFEGVWRFLTLLLSGSDCTTAGISTVEAEPTHERRRPLNERPLASLKILYCNRESFLGIHLEDSYPIDRPRPPCLCSDFDKELTLPQKNYFTLKFA